MTLTESDDISTLKAAISPKSQELEAERAKKEFLEKLKQQRLKDCRRCRGEG